VNNPPSPSFAAHAANASAQSLAAYNAHIYAEGAESDKSMFPGHFTPFKSSASGNRSFEPASNRSESLVPTGRPNGVGVVSSALAGSNALRFSSAIITAAVSSPIIAVFDPSDAVTYAPIAATASAVETPWALAATASGQTDTAGPPYGRGGNENFTGSSPTSP
jgi:hypothetical protein